MLLQPQSLFLGVEMKPFDMDQKTIDGMIVFHIKGYFSDYAGKKMQDTVDEHLKSGAAAFVFDFSGCPLINSPGIVAIANIAMKIVDDFRGRIVLCGLDDLKTSVLNVAGVFPTAEYSGTLEESLQKLKSPQ